MKAVERERFLQAVRDIIDDCTHPDCVEERIKTGFASCAGGQIARRVVKGLRARLAIKEKPPKPDPEIERGRLAAARFAFIESRIEGARSNMKQWFEIKLPDPLLGSDIMKGSVAEHFRDAVDKARK